MKKDKKTAETSLLFGLTFFSRSKEELLEKLTSDLKRPQELKIVFTPNAEQVVQALEDPRFKNILHQASYLLPDGSGVVFASRWLSLLGRADSIPTWIPGVDVATALLEQSAQQGWKVLVIGGRGYAEQAGSSEDVTQIVIGGHQVFWTPGYIQVERPTSKEEKELVATIQRLKPDIVFVAFGAPKQERWVMEHLDLLQKTRVGIVMAVGGSFDYLLGKVSRAPGWWRRLGMEWLYRLLRQPWRWRRQLRLIKFVGLVAAASVQPPHQK